MEGIRWNGVFASEDCGVWRVAMDMKGILESNDAMRYEYGDVGCSD